MPSQEEYLDSLLKDLSTNEESSETSEDLKDDFEHLDDMPENVERVFQDLNDAEPELEIPDEIADLDDKDDIDDNDNPLEMTEDEIEALLSANKNQQNDTYEDTSQNQTQETNPESDETDDLLNMLENSDEEDLSDIHTMLQKSDNNEAVDDSILDLLQNFENEDDSIPDMNAEEEMNLLLGENDSKKKKGKSLFKRRHDVKNRKTKDVELEDKQSDIENEETEDIGTTNSKLENKRKNKKGLFGKKKVDPENTDESKKGINSIEKEPIEEEVLGQDIDNILEDDSDGLEAVVLDDIDDLDNLGTLDLDTKQDIEGIDDDLLKALSEDDLFSEDNDLLPEEETPSKSQETDSHEKIAEAEIEKIQNTQKKKQSLASKIINMFTEEDEEQPEESEIILSEENINILKELDSDKKKKKKKDKKSNKKETSETAKSEDDLDEEEKDKKKEKKKKKPKKQKAPKLREAYSSEKKLSKKRVFLVMMVCFSIGLVILVINSITGDYVIKRTAKTAFYEEDYQTCYQNLYGQNLNETEEVMFYKSESILRIRIWLREYEIFAEEGSELRALDSLIQSVAGYPILLDFSTQWNASLEVSEVYQEILAILSNKYHLSEEQAKEIAGASNDVEYTKMVMTIIAGGEFGSWNNIYDMEEEITDTDFNENAGTLVDPLPEEEYLTDSEFVDNIQ